MPEIDPDARETLQALPDDLLREVEAAELPGLAGGPPQPAVADLVEALERDPGAQGPRRIACLSGLWLLAGDLERSHNHSQSLSTPEGSFWHGIMHRREGDFMNAKYWFRRVGNHPVIDRMAELDGLRYPSADAFVDACASAIREGGDAERACRQLQWREWQSLMTHCLR